MQHSENKNTNEDAGKNFAVLVEVLYIVNLLLLPVVAYIILVYLFMKKHGSLPLLAESHLEQTVHAGIWIAILFVVAAMTVMILNISGIEDLTLWMLAIITFTILHASMVLLGIIGLAKALSGKCWRYPVVGKALRPGCRI